MKIVWILIHISQEFDKKILISLGIGLLPLHCQAINWTSGDPVLWCQ